MPTATGITAPGASTPPTTPAPTPTPTPRPTPTPTLPPGATSSRFDGTYDFFFKYPGSGGTSRNESLSRYLIIRAGAITTSDGLARGTVDATGNIQFTSPCPVSNGSTQATWVGIMNISAGAGNFGQGTYSCNVALGGTQTWQANQSR
jgi:hypothetical protein